MTNDHQWPTPQFELPTSIPEVKAVVLSVPISTQEKLWERYSNTTHTLRIISWCRRFCRNCNTAIDRRTLTPHLQAEEVSDTRKHLVTLEQREHFPEVFKALRKDIPLPKGHPFRKFAVSKSSTGLLLLATRIRDFQAARQPRKLIPLSLKSALT